MGESTTSQPYRAAPPGALSQPRRVPWIVRVNVVLGGFPSLAALFFFDAMSAMCWFLPPTHAIENAAGIVMVAIMLIVLGPLMIVHVIGRLMATRFLRLGVVGYATLRGRIVSPARVTYRLHFTFEHDGGEYGINLETHDPRLGVDERQAQIVFVPGRERDAIVIDTLPGRPRIRDDNSVDPRPHVLGGVLAIVLLVVACSVNAIGAIAWLR